MTDRDAEFSDSDCYIEPMTNTIDLTSDGPIGKAIEDLIRTKIAQILAERGLESRNGAQNDHDLRRTEIAVDSD